MYHCTCYILSLQHWRDAVRWHILDCSTRSDRSELIADLQYSASEEGRLPASLIGKGIGMGCFSFLFFFLLVHVCPIER